MNMRSAQVFVEHAPRVECGDDLIRDMLLHGDERIIGGHRSSVFAHRSAKPAIGAISGLAFENISYCSRNG